MDILQSDSPPLLGGFHSFDTEASREKVWGIYIVLMEKAGDKPKLYVGSGTSSEGGVRQRFSQYDQRYLMSRYIRDAFLKGYTITNLGLLCWAPIPPANLRPSTRLRFLTIEAGFCIVFFFLPFFFWWLAQHHLTQSGHKSYFSKGTCDLALSLQGVGRVEGC